MLGLGSFTNVAVDIYSSLCILNTVCWQASGGGAEAPPRRVRTVSARSWRTMRTVTNVRGVLLTHNSSFYYSTYTAIYRYIGSSHNVTAAAARLAMRTTPSRPPALPLDSTHIGGSGTTAAATKQVEEEQRRLPSARSRRPKIDLPRTRDRGALSRPARPLPTSATLPQAHPPQQLRAGAREPHLPSPCPSQEGRGRFRKVRAGHGPHAACKRAGVMMRTFCLLTLHLPRR